MTARLHPMFGALAREGAAPARLMQAVAVEEDRVLALARALEEQPLEDGAEALSGLVMGAGGTDRTAEVLARLAALDEPAPEADPQRRIRAQVGEAPVVAKAGPQHSSGPTAELAHAKGLGLGAEKMRKDRVQVGKAEVPRPVSGQVRLSEAKGRVASTKVDGVKAGRSPNSVTSDPTSRAADRPVCAPALRQAEQAAAIQRILAGEAAVVAETPALPALPATEIETRIDAVLQQLVPAEPSGSFSRTAASPDRRPRVVSSSDTPSKVSPPEATMPTKRAQTPSNPVPLGAQSPQPAPRNGLERLLVRARVPLTPPPGASQDNQAVPEPQVAAPRPDLAAPQGAHDPGRALSQPVAPADAPAADTADMARALHDLIRKEARAAGIDLGGGAS